MQDLHGYNFSDNAVAELFSEHLQDLGLVEGEIMAHGGGIKFYEKDFIPDKNLFGPAGDRFSYEPLPGFYNIRLIVLTWKAIGIEQIAYGLPYRLKFIFFIAHKDSPSPDRS